MQSLDIAAKKSGIAMFFKLDMEMAMQVAMQVAMQGAVQVAMQVVMRVGKPIVP